MFDDDEDVMGEPSFELWLQDGRLIVSGCYFMHPVLKVSGIEWRGDRVVVRATDDSLWFADDAPRTGKANVALQPLGE